MLLLMRLSVVWHLAAAFGAVLITSCKDIKERTELLQNVARSMRKLYLKHEEYLEVG